MSEILIDAPAATALRLRRSVHVRTLEQHGVAVSAGHDAIVLDGTAAEHLWAALEPRLRQGVTPEELLAGVPERAHRATRGLWEQLVDHRLVCAAGPDGEQGPGPLAEHFERTAPDPTRALARADQAVVGLDGDPGLTTMVREALADTGISTSPPADDLPVGGPVHGPALGPGTGDLAVLTLRLPDQELHQILLARAGGHRLVGPVPAEETAHRALARWLALRAEEGLSPLGPRDQIADRLAAAQAVLLVLELVAEVPRQDAHPRYHVTSPDVVAELHPLAVLPHPGPVTEVVDLTGLLAAAAPTAAEDDVLRDAEPLWSGPLATWSGPVPGDLPQLPIGLATAAVGRHELVGVGLDTADARMSCLEQLVEAETGLSVGRHPVAAAARAITRATAQGPWVPTGEAPRAGTPLARRLLQALTLREGVEVTLRAHVTGATGGSLSRVSVLDTDGAVLAHGLAPTIDEATQEALLGAVGAAQAARHDVVVDPTPGPRLPGTQRSLVRWADEHGVVLRSPVHPPSWAVLGLHACSTDLSGEHS